MRQAPFIRLDVDEMCAKIPYVFKYLLFHRFDVDRIKCANVDPPTKCMLFHIGSGVRGRCPAKEMCCRRIGLRSLHIGINGKGALER